MSFICRLSRQVSHAAGAALSERPRSATSPDGFTAMTALVLENWRISVNKAAKDLLNNHDSDDEIDSDDLYKT